MDDDLDLDTGPSDSGVGSSDAFDDAGAASAGDALRIVEEVGDIVQDVAYAVDALEPVGSAAALDRAEARYMRKVRPTSYAAPATRAAAAQRSPWWTILVAAVGAWALLAGIERFLFNEFPDVYPTVLLSDTAQHDIMALRSRCGEALEISPLGAAGQPDESTVASGTRQALVRCGAIWPLVDVWLVTDAAGRRTGLTEAR